MSEGQERHPQGPASASIPMAARTDVGRRREHNEDALAAAAPLIAVADGVGGSAKGEVASQLTIDTISARVGTIAGAATAQDAVRAMEQAVLDANTAVHEAQLADPALRGMATTLSAAVVRDGGEVVVGHVGDSRLYVISAAGARPATEDHSVVAELVRTGQLDPADVPQHPQRNVITRALGPEADVSVDAFVLRVGPGDWLLACSDGLTEHVTDPELARALLANPGDPDAAVEQLVDLANERGGSDNISVVVAQPVPSDVSGELRVEQLQAAAATTGVATTAQIPRVDAASVAPAEASGPLRAVEASGEMPALQPLGRDMDWGDAPDSAERLQRRSTRRGWALLVLVVLLAVAAGAFVWSQSYFLVEREDGRVGINQGFPFARLATPYRSSDVAATELSKADRERLVDSHRLLSQDDAQRVLDDLVEQVEGAAPTTDLDADGAADGLATSS